MFGCPRNRVNFRLPILDPGTFTKSHRSRKKALRLPRGRAGRASGISKSTNLGFEKLTERFRAYSCPGFPDPRLWSQALALALALALSILSKSTGLQFYSSTVPHILKDLEPASL